MDRRRLLMILAVFVAVIGTLLVFVYVKGADNRANSKLDNVNVLKATADIKAGESYDTALANGEIAVLGVPSNQQNPGVVTDTSLLKGKVVSVPIFTGQQILASQFGNTAPAATSALNIPKGKIAISVNLTDPDRVAGNIEPGSDVAIFVTGTLKASTAGGAAGATGDADVQTTRLLLPSVTVLNVGSPQPTTSTTTDTTGAQTTETLPRTLLTIAVNQKEAQAVIVASKALDLTFGLLTPDSSVHPGPGTTTLINSLFR
jgi:pilus assembly protein CpaB